MKGSALKEFLAAASDQINEVSDTEQIEFIHEGAQCKFYEPGSGQLAVMLGMARRRMDTEAAGTFISLMFNMMDSDTSRYFEMRLMDRKDPFDLDGENGLLHIFEWLSEEWSARPTKEPSDYQRSPRATGRKSTAPSSEKASTSSTSRSRASSR